MTNWLSSGTKFDAIVANNDEMALGAINALKAAKKWTPDFVVAGIDATPDALASMKAGELKVTVFQNAAGQGSGAIDAAHQADQEAAGRALRQRALRAGDAGQPEQVRRQELSLIRGALSWP